MMEVHTLNAHYNIQDQLSENQRSSFMPMR
jgi:hypothetical protein